MQSVKIFSNNKGGLGNVTKVLYSLVLIVKKVLKVRNKFAEPKKMLYSLVLIVKKVLKVRNKFVEPKKM